MLAQSLRTGSTLTVGFVLRDIANPLFANVARRCERELRRHGLSMVITSSDGDVEVEARNLSLLRRRRVDGIICSLVSEETPETIEVLRSFSAPVILLDREVPGLEAAAVLCDHATGVRRATAELLSRGHRRIGILSGSLAVRSSRERLRGYLSAYGDADIAADPSLQAFASFDAKFAKAETLRLLSAREPATALLTGGVPTTAGALRALRQLRLTLGQDVSLIALDEWPFFDALTPNLASVSRDSDEMGAASAQLIIGMLNGDSARTITVDTVFTARDSIGPPLKTSETSGGGPDQRGSSRMRV
jgi:LacI family transcriptional regulator